MTGSVTRSFGIVAMAFVAGSVACTGLTDATRDRDANPPAGLPGENLPGLYGGYAPAGIPHWPHLRTQMSDYRIQYLADASARTREYAWSAAHFDRIVLDAGDPRSVAEYRRLLPQAELYRYVLTWTVPQPVAGSSRELGTTYYAHMQAWYTRHPEYRLEDAFLHDAAKCGIASRSPTCRIAVHIWRTDRWVVNPGDAGLRGYDRERLAQVVADADGLFVDEHSSGDMADRLKPVPLLEYADWALYERDIVQLLREARAALGTSKRLLINTFNYTDAWDVEMAAAAGGAHAEALNNPIFPEMENRWKYVESVLAAGASMNVLPDRGALPVTYTSGGSATPTARRRMWELASFYLVAPPQPGLLFLNSLGDSWSEPFATSWSRAVEADIGLPTAGRTIIAEGRDPTARAYRVWGRDYTRALVLVRPVVDWNMTTYGDETGIEIDLPTGERFRPLNADGGLSPAVQRVLLRAGEAAILIKENRVDVVASPVRRPGHLSHVPPFTESDR